MEKLKMDENPNKTCYNPVLGDGLFHETSFWTLWLSAIPLVTLCLVSLTANAAIIIMFATKAKLRKCRNTYIMSLAIADFLIGLTLPVSIVETIGEEWVFTEGFCTVFLTVRQSLYYVTILSIVLITVDRWWSVNFPFSYRIRRSKTMACVLAVFIWVLSFLIHIPSIAGWTLLHPPTSKHHNYCRVPYEYNAGFTISVSVIEFFIPLVILISLNSGLYIKLANRRNSKQLRRSLSTSDGNPVNGRKSSSDSDNTNYSEELSELITTLPKNSNGRRKSSSFLAQYRKLLSDRKSDHSVTKLMTPRHASCHRLSVEYSSLFSSMPMPRKYSTFRKYSRASISSKSRSHDDVVRDFLMRQDTKALMSLGLLVIMFIVCWTPLIFCDILYSLCPSNIPLWAMQLAYWILALNSALNPFLYGIGSSDFRRVAQSWFYCTKNKNLRVLQTLLYNQMIQPCDMIALREVETSANIQNNKEPLHYV